MRVGGVRFVVEVSVFDEPCIVVAPTTADRWKAMFCYVWLYGVVLLDAPRFDGISKQDFGFLSQ